MAKFETSENLPIYFKDIKDSTPLSKEEEVILAARIKAGDEKALNELVEANLKIVVTIANKYIGLGLSLDDLIQEGNAGLVHAAGVFDSGKNVKFISYAQFWIHKYINTALGTVGRMVRLPMNQEYDIYKAKKSGEDVQLGTIRLDQPVGEEGDNTLGDLILKVEPEAIYSLEEEDRDSLIKGLLARLSNRDREIVELFYGLGGGDPMSMNEIAEHKNIQPREVGVALKTARSQMRKAVADIEID